MGRDDGAVSDPLTGVDLFAGLAPQVRGRIASVAVPRSYPRGRILFLEGDAGDSLIVVRRGAVSVFRTAPSGGRALLAVVRAPDVLGEVSLLDGASRSASAEALEDTEVLAVSRAAFLDLVHRHPVILDAVIRSVGTLIRRLTDQTADHIFLDLQGRVAKTLVRLAGQSRDPVVVIDLSQRQLAEMAGASRQSVNQALGAFAKRGWLHTEGGRIVVSDLPALRGRGGMD